MVRCKPRVGILMAARVLRLGTRGSPLARAQTAFVRERLRELAPGLVAEEVVIRTTGDRGWRGALPPVGLKGLFVKEIEEALAAGAVDVGVHSMKDLPAELAPGLLVGAVPPRADARDVLVARSRGGLAGLDAGTRVGTGSVRRRAQLLAHRRDLDVIPMRGNVDTRLARWREGTVDALVLGAAGLTRLGIEESGACPLSPGDFLPAVGQGAIGLECRQDDSWVRTVLAGVSDPAAETAATAERAFLLAIGGDCNTPLAAYATVTDHGVSLQALVTDPEGVDRLEEQGTAPVAEAALLGRRVAEHLLARGAGALLGR